MKKPFLSLVIPAYNEAARLPNTLEQACEFLKAQPYDCEVIVAENGSTDNTYELALSYQTSIPQLKVLHLDERGKGSAVRSGMLAARGDYRFICDADFSMSPDQILKFVPPALKGADVAIATREGPGAQRLDEPAYRHIIGRAFNLLVRLVVLPGLHDSQCGFKCFSAEVAEKVFPLQTINGWTFDVEVLFIARRKGYRVAEVPITWQYHPNSKVHFVRDSVRMALDLLRIRLNALFGRYDPR